MFTDFITNMINSLSELLYSHILIILLLGAGIFFTIKTKFVQIRMFIESLRVVAQPGSDKNGLSSFQALMVSTASRVGTGNIAGISTAICLGGSGAVFWMWLTAILGSASAFIESTLAQIYKHKAKDGSSYGGPAYYIQAALKKRWIGVLFAVVLILTYMGGFNLVASFNIADSFRVYSFFNPEWTPLIVGAILAVVFALAVFGGSKKISQITEVLVPVMGIFYLAVSLFIILKHYRLVPRVCRILRYARYQKRTVLQRSRCRFCSECSGKRGSFPSGKTRTCADAFCIHRHYPDLLRNSVHASLFRRRADF